MKISGISAGAFSLHLEETYGDGHVVLREGFSNVPVTADSICTVALPADSAQSSLVIDLDGDGVADFIINSGDSVEPFVYVSALSRIVSSYSLSGRLGQDLSAKISAAQSALRRDNANAFDGGMKAFMNAVAAQKGKALTEKQASVLQALATLALKAQ